MIIIYFDLIAWLKLVAYLSVASETICDYQIILQVNYYSQMLLEITWTPICCHLFVIYCQKIFTISKGIVTIQFVCYFSLECWWKVNVTSSYYLIESPLQDFVFFIGEMWTNDSFETWIGIVYHLLIITLFTSECEDLDAYLDTCLN